CITKLMRRSFQRSNTSSISLLRASSVRQQNPGWVAKVLPDGELPISTSGSAMAQTPQDWHLQETYKSLITISVECLKILIVINGGAAVAMLTYIGSLVGRSSPPRAADLTPALLSYCFGVFAAALAFILAYLVQLKLY